MNQTLEIIKKRRTTRKFKSTAIDKKSLEAILEAGLYAPSAHNDQSWHFTVIENEDLLDELNHESKKCAKDFPDPIIQKMACNENFNIFYSAPTIVVVSGRETAMMPEVDCAAATQNMLIAAESLDIGACWNGFVGFLFNSKKGDLYKEKLHIPKEYKPYYAVALGHKDVHAQNAPKRKPDAVNYL